MWFRQLGKDANKGLDTAWQQGIWLGHARTSNEHLIGTKDGVVRAHSVKRHDPPHLWHAATVRDLKGTPQQPDPSRPTTRVPIRLQDSEAVIVPNPPGEDEGQPGAGKFHRRFRIRPDHLERYGHTPGCNRLPAPASGAGTPQPH